MSFEKLQKKIAEDNLRAKKEVKEFYAQMEELDIETKLTTNKEIMEIDTEKINTISIKSKVNPENDMTLCLAFSKMQKRFVLKIV